MGGGYLDLHHVLSTLGQKWTVISHFYCFISLQCIFSHIFSSIKYSERPTIHHTISYFLPRRVLKYKSLKMT
jgi:hypothetical protein